MSKLIGSSKAVIPRGKFTALYAIHIVEEKKV